MENFCAATLATTEETMESTSHESVSSSVASLETTATKDNITGIWMKLSIEIISLSDVYTVFHKIGTPLHFKITFPNIDQFE